VTNQERDRAFRAAAAASVKGRTALLRNTRDEIVRLLKLAQQQIATILAGQPTDYQLWSLPQLSKEISRVLATFGEQGSSVISTAAGSAWQAGIDLVDKPLEAAGVRIAATLGTPDTGQLMAMRAFMTGRIANISTVSADAINSELGLVVIGAQSPGDAITAVNRILGGKASARATTIVRTELGRVFSAASFARMQQAVANGANIKKKWIKSGKVHSRPGHDAIDGEVRNIDEPWWVMGKDGEMHALMYPHDPTAPASETINCGCVATPVAPDWQSMVGKPDGTPYTNAELRARAAAFAEKHGLPDGRGIPKLQK